MDRYRFHQVGFGDCIEYCNVKDNGTMIGSVACQECEHCIEVDTYDEESYVDTPKWIKCDVIEQATGKE